MGNQYSKKDLSIYSEDEYIEKRIIQKFGEPVHINDSYIILNEIDSKSFAPPYPSVDWRIEKEKVREEYHNMHV